MKMTDYRNTFRLCSTKFRTELQTKYVNQLQIILLTTSILQSTLDDLVTDIKIPEFLKKDEGEKAGEVARKKLEEQHQAELLSFQQSLKKAEKEIGYKEEEIRHFKNMAGNQAE